MNNDSYKVIISVSHHRIAFEYWQRDGENALVPMPGINWPVPLAFYCSPTGIEIGEAGVRAAHAGTANAFDNYFERLVGDEHYVFGGQKKPLRYIFLDAAEEVFTEFFKNVLLGSKGTLSDNRATMPVTLVCESDIKPNERALLLNLFRDSGYNRFKVVEYNSYIENYFRTSLAQEYGGKEMVVAWTEGKDLTLSLFSLTNANGRRQETFIGLGKDPRQEYVKGLIWERIKGQNPWLEYEEQENIISKAASDFLSSSLPLLNDRLTMSGGMSYHYSLTRSVIDHLQCEEGILIRSNLERFLSASGIKDKKQVLLLLRGLTAGNVYFEQNLCSGFPFVLKTDKRLRSNTMHLLLSEPNPYHSADSESVISTVFQQEQESTAFQPFVNNMEVFPHSSEFGSQNKETGNTSISNPVDSRAVMKMGREMRAARANINAKYSRGDKVAAAKEYKTLLKGWNDSAPVEILSELHDWLEKKGISRDDLLNVSDQAKPSKPERLRPIPNPKNDPEENKAKSDKDEKKSNEMVEGERLLKEGRFSEAKRFFAGVGNEHMKQLCIDLLRDSRDLKAMASQNLSSLSPTARKNNLDKLKRIQVNYRKAGLPAQEVENLIGKLK